MGNAADNRAQGWTRRTDKGGTEGREMMGRGESRGDNNHNLPKFISSKFSSFL